jgi:ribose transport system substrate-binding protein
MLQNNPSKSSGFAGMRSDAKGIFPRRNVGLVVFVVLILVILWVTGCGETLPAPQTVASTQSVVAPVREGSFVFLAANISDPFYNVGRAGFDAAGKAVGMKTEFTGPQDLSTTAQMDTFTTLVNSPNTKGIFLYAINCSVAESMGKTAKEKGVPLVFGSMDCPNKNRDAFIGYDNNILGQQAGAWIAKKLDCKGVIGTIGVATGENVNTRIDAFNNYLKANCPDMKVYDRVGHDGSAANAAQVLESMLVAHPDMTLIWFADGGSGQQSGLWKEKQAAGVKTLFLATDMTPAALQAVKDGVFYGAIAQDTFTEAYTGAWLLNELMLGHRVPDTTLLSAILIDQSNVDLFLKK